MRETKSLDTDSLVDFQWQKALVAHALKRELANSFMDVAGTEIVLPGASVIRLIQLGMNSFGSRAAGKH
ncbi:MAG: hypothetical protein ACREXR_24120 [Gammaproteobacteria bacterium]